MRLTRSHPQRRYRGPASIFFSFFSCGGVGSRDLKSARENQAQTRAGTAERRNARLAVRRLKWTDGGTKSRIGWTDEWITNWTGYLKFHRDGRWQAELACVQPPVDGNAKLFGMVLKGSILQAAERKYHSRSEKIKRRWRLRDPALHTCRLEHCLRLPSYVDCTEWYSMGPPSSLASVQEKRMV